MNLLKDRFEDARKKAGYSQGALAQKVGISQTAVLNIESGKTKKSGYLADLARVLGVTYDWLAEGIGPRHLNSPDEASDINLPFYSESEANDGPLVSVNKDGPWLRMQQSILDMAHIDAANAACVAVNGDGMAPLLPDGAIAAIDTTNNTVKDGELYAIDWHGELYIKILTRRPGGGLRIRSYNTNEYPDENLTKEEAEQIKVLGRVFWYSVLR